MPRARKYESRAAQQAAYRERLAASQAALLATKGLPPLPAIASLPGSARWRAMLLQARLLLESAAQEMEHYVEDRSDSWQESCAGEAMLERVERLQEVIAALEAIE